MESNVMIVGVLVSGILVVIGGILALRLHAFLALILGGLAVGLLTPTAWREGVAIEKQGARIVPLAAETMPASDSHAKPEETEKTEETQIAVSGHHSYSDGQRLELMRRNRHSSDYRILGTLEIVRSNAQRSNQAGAAATIVHAIPLADDTLQPQPDDILIESSGRKAAQAVARQSVGQRLANGFGTTCAKIGILIAMASIIGKCLLDSGAADRIVRSLLKWLGERGAPVAFLSSGFLLGIPVFFDTVFYLMIPLGKALRMRTSRNYLLYVLTIVAGATMAHSLVPPTPGPLFVAEQLHVDLGIMILAGCLIGSVTVVCGFLWAQLANRLWELPLRETPDISMKELEAVAHRDETDLPPLWLALLPIVLPVVLIGGDAVVKRVGASFPEDVPETALRISATLGDKNLALILAAGIALATLMWQKRTTLGELAQSVQSALASGGVIILITMLIRTAQGSATVAMITAVGILSGIAADLPFHPVYLALAIGCGSKPIAWMNDSGFWVITKMSGMTESEGLKYVTPMTAAMGVVGLGATLVAATVFPGIP